MGTRSPRLVPPATAVGELCRSSDVPTANRGSPLPAHSQGDGRDASRGDRGGRRRGAAAEEFFDSKPPTPVLPAPAGDASSDMSHVVSFTGCSSPPAQPAESKSISSPAGAGDSSGSCICCMVDRERESTRCKRPGEPKNLSRRATQVASSPAACELQVEYLRRLKLECCWDHLTCHVGNLSRQPYNPVLTL